LILISKSQARLQNASHVEGEDKFIEEDFFVDWISSPIYYIYPDEEDLLSEVSFMVDTIKFNEENNDYHVFDESLNSEGYQLSNEEISYIDLLGIEKFLLNSPSNNLNVGFGVLDYNSNFRGQERIDHSLKIFMERKLEKINERRVNIDLFQVGARKSISIIHNQVVMSCMLFLFRMEWINWTSKRSRQR
jgi:hypothetical protein